MSTKQDLTQAALDYHEFPRPGKIEVTPTKSLTNQNDLALAYSPGVAAACNAIADDPAAASRLTARGNLVAVVTNGTAVLGLGSIGPLAAKPVMEGKGVLFKKFAGIDVFDIEIEERDPDRLVDIVAALQPTFGAINLEDIKAPECFHVEERLKQRMNIPVFHDDQHGTAIIVGAAVLNALEVVGKDIRDVRLVSSGAGAAALACLGLLVRLGLPLENIIATDIHGVVYEGRPEDMDPVKQRFARRTDMRTLAEAVRDADIFLGLSAGGVLKPDMVATMAARPIILALANPVPEILPEQVRAVRDDAIIATGRSDYPNQVNNVLCFPFIFRGALDVGATAINEDMELAVVKAIAELARAEQSEEVVAAYGGQRLSFGPEYLIPKPFDPRLLVQVAPAVARAAMGSGVATRPIVDFDAYRSRLTQFVYHSGMLMKPVFTAARNAEYKRILYAEGEDERVLRAAQLVLDEGIAQPILVGRPHVIAERIEELGLRIRPEQDFELVNPDYDPRYERYWQEYHRLRERDGITPNQARVEMRQRRTLIGSMMVRLGDADGMLCGIYGRYPHHLEYIDAVIGLKRGASTFAAMNVLMLPGRTLFICDTYVNLNPSAEEVARITLLAAEAVRRFGIRPKVALLSHSNFGAYKDPEATKMREARKLLDYLSPGLEVEGEMHGDAALEPEIRQRLFPNSKLEGEANVLVMPNLAAANIAFNLVKTTGGQGITVGPILLGAAAPVHILSPSATVRRIVNMSALAVVDANSNR